MKTQTSLFFAVIVFLLVFAISTSAPVDNDMWWHLRAGDEMWHQGKILLTDQFSYTKFGESWVNAFWLSDLGLYGLWSLGGFFAIAVTVSLLAVMVMLIIFLQMEGSVYLRGLLVILAMMGAIANWAPRPQLISFLIFAALDFFLQRHLTFNRQPLWVLPLLFIAWGNFHGGYIWGALLLFAVIVGEVFNRVFDNQPSLSWKEIRHLSLWSVLAILVVPINPNGLMMWKLPFYQVEVSLSIQEWLSPDFHQFYSHPMLWLLFLLIFGLAFAGKRMSFVDLFKGLGFAYMFFFAQRNLVAYTIVIAPIVARYLNPALANLMFAPNVKNFLAHYPSSAGEMPPKVTKIINLFLVGFLAAAFLVYSFFVSLPVNIARKVPERSAAWLEANQPRGRIFNSYNWGGYLTWRARDYPVFIDGRADLYGDALIQEWMEISRGTEKGLALLDLYQINLVYLEPGHALLSKLSPQMWKKTYSDSQIVIYQRLP